MAVISRIVIHERERVVVLKKLKAWDLSGNDHAENALGIGSHSSLPYCGYRESHPAGAAAAMDYSHRRYDRPPEAARRIARRSVQIACGSRSRDGISPPAACCAAAIRAGEAQAAHCRSLDLRLALSAVTLLA